MTDFFIRFIADLLVIPVFLIAAYVLVFKIPKGQRFEAYSRILMAGLTAYLMAKFVASIYQPNAERPFQMMGIEPGALYLDNPGFPSDHVLFVFTLSAAVWFETKMKRTALVLLGMSVLIGLGRILALVHTPLDVLGGVVFAAIGTLWYLNNSKKAGGSKGSSLWRKFSRVK